MISLIGTRPWTYQIDSMKPVIPLFLSVFLIASISAKELTLEAIYSDAGLTGPRLRSPAFSPDSKLITFLRGRPEDANRYDLWAHEVETGEQSRLVNADDLFSNEEILSDEEKARRERMRFQGSGITSYQWNEDGTGLLFPLAGDLYYYDVIHQQAKQLTQTEAFELDAKFSADGKLVAFIRDQDIFVLNLETGEERAVTTDGEGPIKNGMAEFVVQEEIQRFTGYWWSPHDNQIAFIRVDESAVTEVKRNEIYADHIKIIEQRYPYTGEANASSKLGVIDLNSGSTQWIDTGDDPDFYIPWVKWTGYGNLLTYQWQSRDQQRLELRVAGPVGSTPPVLIEETSTTWINLHQDLRFFENDNRILWSSEKTGYKHLYVITNDQETPLTTGNWVVSSVASVDEKNEWAYFTGWTESPTEQHLYRVNLDGSNATQPQQISQRAGHHKVTFSADSQYYFDSYSNINQPTQVSLHRADGTLLTYLLENKLDEGHPLNPYLESWIDPVFGTLPANDGTELHYKYFKPITPEPADGFPVITYVYGGPLVGQQVRNAWSNTTLWAQYMAARGYVVFTLDNRGSYNRGKAFEDVIYKQLGDVELQDQVAGAKWLEEQSWVDGDRIGIYGHSYGGYMTLMAMFKAGDTYTAGVSGAPVTDYRLYDTHYTERYLSTPQKNADGYDASSVFPYTEGLSGNLLIYHGMADDNVLFVNTTKLIKQLQDQGKVFDFMAYPGSKHGFDNQTNLHRAKTIEAFFSKNL